MKTDPPTLFALDGSKALRAAVERVWGRWAVVQRCQVHKIRNVKAHLHEKHHGEVVQRLKRIQPAPAASLEEGLEETITVVRLGIPPQLARRWQRRIRSRVPSASRRP